MMLATRNPANAQAPTSPPIRYRAWVGGAIGAAPTYGPAAEWEVWLSRGKLGVGYQASATDDISGTTNGARGMLVGAVLPYGRALGRVAGGLASARRCIVRGEQAAARTCVDGTAVELSAAVDIPIGSRFAIHTSFFSIPSPSIGHSAFVVGVAIGRFAR
jgi:hypothetical protein